MYSTYVTNIRYEEKASIKDAMSPGSILQIYGPPMAGKAVLVDQVISDIESTIPLNRYEVMCQGLNRLEDVLVLTLQSSDCAFNGAPTISTAIRRIKASLAGDKDILHVLTFYKCECLQLDGNDHKFIHFIASLVDQCARMHLRICIIFTSYVLFPYQGLKIELITIGMLTDHLDIVSLLSRYAPEVPCLNAPGVPYLRAPEVSCLNGYVNICRQILNFPEGVARIAEEFLNTKPDLPSSECLQEMIISDPDFLSIIFKKRLNEVEKWMSENEMRFILSCRPTFLRTYTEDLLQGVYQTQNPTHNDQQWLRFLKKILAKQLVQQESTNLTIHPLVVYYCLSVKTSNTMTSINSYSWNVLFLSRVLIKVEDNIAILEKSSQLTTSWLDVRLMLQKAIHRPDDGSFDSFFKVGIHAGRLLYLNFPDDGKVFYSNLLQAAEQLGSAGHRAVVEANCGNISSYGAVIDWQTAEKLLESSMVTLKKEGMFYFYRWAVVRNAIALQRQSKHQKALKYYEAAKETLTRQSRTDVEDNLKVPKLLEDEDNLTAEIYETIPMIYTGKTKEAFDKLMNLYQNKKPLLEHHLFYYILLNNIGLAIERGENNIQKALVWYKMSLDVRRTVGKINPQILVLSLNNIASLLLLQRNPESLQESEEYLMEALRLQSETHWHYRDKALTLNNLAKVNVKKHDFFKAFKFNLEALSLLQSKAKNSDFSLQVLLDLVHCRIVLGLQSSQLEQTEPEFDNTILDKSVEDYLQEIVDIERFSKVDSSDFHLMFLSACVHGLAISSGSCKDRFEKYKSCFIRHVDRHGLFSKTGETIFKNEPYFLGMCRNLYDFLQSAEFNGMDVQIVNKYVVRFCVICAKLGENIRDYPWKRTGERNISLSSVKESGDKGMPRNVTGESSSSRQPAISDPRDHQLDISETVRNSSEPGEDRTAKTGSGNSDLLSTAVRMVVNPSECGVRSNESGSDIPDVLNKSMSCGDDRSTSSTDNDPLHTTRLLNPSESSQTSGSGSYRTCCSSLTGSDLCPSEGIVVNPSINSTEN